MDSKGKSRRDFILGALSTAGAVMLAGIGCNREKEGAQKAPASPSPPGMSSEPCVCPPPPAASNPPATPQAPDGFKPWVGKMARSEVKWGPTVDAGKCIGCAVCMNCGPKVFDFIDNKSVVKNFGKCVPGCTTCKNLCPTDAISFPDLAPVKEVFTRNHVYENMKTWLQEAGKLPRS